MRDLHLRDTLQNLARDAAGVFTDIVSGGQEIPYEIEEPGDSFAFCHYRPLTARFVRDNAAELRELESFRSATELMRRGDLAAAYLEEAGIAPPPDPFERSTLAVTFFLARLWDGASEFDLDAERLAAALEEVEACAEPGAGEVEAIVPLLGFEMDGSRLDLHDASIVRADAVDAPADATRGERPSSGSWKPSFLIAARVGLDEDGGLGGAGDRVARTFERVVTVLRLHRPGGVALGPHAWVRVSGDRWRRISTGAGRARGGTYKLVESEAGAVADLSRTIGVHHQRLERLQRPVMRFEAGLDRRNPVDGLCDHLLALRFMLDGEGPAGLGLAMRTASVADCGERDAIRELVDSALEIERRLFCGEPIDAQGMTPAAVAAGIEETVRSVLRLAVAGELGSDLRAAADESLLADGLALGEGSATGAGGTTEWDLEPVEAGEPESGLDAAEAYEDWDSEPAEAYEEPDSEAFEPELEPSVGPDTGEFERFERDPAPQIRASRGPGRAAEVSGEPEPALATGGEPREAEAAHQPEVELWLGEGDESPSMDFPARENHIDELSRPPMDREEVRERVEYLFPRTETDWTVGGEGDRAARAS